MLIKADARMIPLSDESIDCIVTSPPYFGLRDYGDERQIGREATPDEYVQSLIVVSRELWRVLKPTGTAWINLGDSYAGSNTSGSARPGAGKADGIVDARAQRNRDGNGCPPGLKPKDLIGVPWRVALALQAEGWYLRSDIVWSKPNPMPESVSDRPTRSHEYLFLMSKSDRYFYDAPAIAEDVTQDRAPSRKVNHYGTGANGPKRSGNKARKHGGDAGRPGSDLGRSVPWEDANGKRNRRSVWSVSVQPFVGAHFATMPEKLVEPCIMAGCPGGGSCSIRSLDLER